MSCQVIIYLFLLWRECRLIQILDFGLALLVKFFFDIPPNYENSHRNQHNCHNNKYKCVEHIVWYFWRVWVLSNITSIYSFYINSINNNWCINNWLNYGYRLNPDIFHVLTNFLCLIYLSFFKNYWLLVYRLNVNWWINRCEIGIWLIKWRYISIWWLKGCNISNRYLIVGVRLILLTH